MTEVILPIMIGMAGYFVINFTVHPVLEIMSLRREIHRTILQYANIWGIDPHNEEYSISRINTAREKYRELAARGEAEYENLTFSKWYFGARIYLHITHIKIKEASGKLWAMESDAARPDGDFRKSVVTEIREYLNLPQDKATKR